MRKRKKLLTKEELTSWLVDYILEHPPHLSYEKKKDQHFLGRTNLFLSLSRDGDKYSVAAGYKRKFGESKSPDGYSVWFTIGDFVIEDVAENSKVCDFISQSRYRTCTYDECLEIGGLLKSFDKERLKRFEGYIGTRLVSRDEIVDFLESDKIRSHAPRHPKPKDTSGYLFPQFSEEAQVTEKNHYPGSQKRIEITKYRKLSARDVNNLEILKNKLEQAQIKAQILEIEKHYLE